MDNLEPFSDLLLTRVLFLAPPCITRATHVVLAQLLEKRCGPSIKYVRTIPTEEGVENERTAGEGEEAPGV